MRAIFEMRAQFGVGFSNKRGGRKVNSKFGIKALLFAAFTACAFVTVGCGHTDEEMAAKQREIDKLSADLQAAKSQMAQDQAKYQETQSQIDQLHDQLNQAALS